MRGPILVLLTLQYPYGTAETFLETEILFLGKHFDHIYILPSSLVNNVARRVPKNVTILSDLGLNRTEFSLLKLLPFSNHLFHIFVYSLINAKKKWAYIRNYKSMLHHFHNDIQKLYLIEKIIKKYSLQNALYYDYWLANSSLSLSVLKGKNIIKKLVCRTHRFDLYDNRNAEGVVPFKEFRLHEMDRVYPISMHGINYLNKQYPLLKERLELSYLGVVGAKFTPLKSNDIFTIVSCSSLIAFKQVDKIAKALNLVKNKCQWVHFGDGCEYKKIELLVGELPNHISVELAGFVSNEEVLKYYSQNYVDCFISLSSSEGLPVSMMEAQAYGIPIIAPAINGIPEIVNETTGVLLMRDYTVEHVAQKIDDLIKGSITFDRQLVQQHFQEHFDAQINYTAFCESLLEIT